ncbi:phage major capsid protein [Mechercharimyces sp. CAU 1602]|uniref:phage major capsid protein n=1 Tax=Mechercharimyces sp. CAU 1602 TaxID=2973933 RepID=UPI00216285D4|nr:phage major capsid protein [Mechercharimyces sp. CAU 1602]MCS1351153.1 phage major capsid protein [Mechercharimyces sp. CAU 1602]
MSELYQLKMSLKTVGDELSGTESKIAKKAGDPSASIKEIQELKSHKVELQERFDVLKDRHDHLEKEQKSLFQQNKSTLEGVSDPKEKVVKAKAELIRSTIRERPISTDVKAVLGDRNSTGGEKILPTTMTNELLHEPFVKNPLRGISTYTGITNLEIPKITFTLSDDAFIADTAAAKEIAADGDVVTFGRNKFKVFVPISETVLLATDTNLVQTVDQALQSGVAAKEKKVAFNMAPADPYKSLSFYGVGISEVEEKDLYLAIRSAIADLHEDYRDNATVVMRYADYLAIIEKLANNSVVLYNAQPEQILGKPVVFCDSATNPIVGDYRYSHFNYDPEIIYDRQKDVKTGIENFVLTAWFDHKIKLKSAFRIAKVTPEA